MSTSERNLARNKYWTNVDGERYLQVEEFDESYTNQGEGDKAND